MIVTLYNSDGEATAYIDDDGESIYLYSGEPVAWLSNDRVYSYEGRYLGWIQQGWVFDRSGNRSFFTSSASGGPVKPVRQVRPVRGVRMVRPVRGVREVAPVRPVRSMFWSTLESVEFFEQ